MHCHRNSAGNTRRPAALGQQAAVETVIGIAEEHLLPAIAALGDMTGEARKKRDGRCMPCFFIIPFKLKIQLNALSP